MDPVYEGRFLRLLLVERGDEHLFVSFDHWEKGRRGFAPVDAGSIFARRGWSHLRVQAARNDWFLNPDLLAALAVGTRIAGRFARVTTYGFSMGGYAALRCAAALRARRAVAISPQATPDPRRTPFERRWPRARAAADISLDDLSGLDVRGIEALAVYDPRIRADNRQLRVLRGRVRGLHALALPFGGHPATRAIREGGSLGAFTELLLTTPRVASAEALAHHKAARRHSASYRAALDAALTDRCARDG